MTGCHNTVAREFGTEMKELVSKMAPAPAKGSNRAT